MCSTISPSTMATFHSALLPCFPTFEPVCKLILGHTKSLGISQPYQGFIFFLKTKLFLLPASNLQHFETPSPAPPSAGVQDPPLPLQYHFCVSA